MIALDHEAAIRARIVSHRSRCGSGGWHPDAATCTDRNCGLSAVSEAPLIADGVSGAGADLPSLASAPVFPAETGSFFHAPEDAR
ncbi:hypothetical protein CA234_09595 [Sphingomonas sp. ABOLE]|uniref:hypothetical protein n=1 Tax=Sphingomonas sp. ABOLE TaxID=1985878 RepID=UPI000F7F64C2|nr:hypothetical protein [Sphingomonas sp. ABOLE]RSV41515.1 hypothetical protein CA234_09595 [Sphingomonas sp. ABOLE]